jgi:hypothetical protein
VKKVLFLDIDGVLNGHERHPGSPFCGVRPDCMAQLNRVVAATGCGVVLSSAWRYQIITQATTLRGFEYLLYTHGLVPADPVGHPWRLVGLTDADEGPAADRGTQILRYARREGLLPHEWAAVDDDPGGMQLGEHAGRLVRTDPARGLTAADAERLIALLA